MSNKQWLASPVNRVLRFLFGDDIFISYSRADGAIYAAGLADELTKRDFTCRLDQWGTQPGERMPKSLEKALHRSAALVLIGTPGAARSEHVTEEVIAIRQAKRLIVPVLFEGVWLSRGRSLRDGRLMADQSPGPGVLETEALWAREITGLHIAAESAAALDSGKPSERILNRIDKSCSFWRRSQRLRAASAAAAILLVVLTCASAIAAWWARKSTAQALHEQQVAASRQIATRADTLRLRSEQRTEDWVAPLRTGGVLAIEAARRLTELGIPQAEAFGSLRRVLDLLPRSAKRLEVESTIMEALLTPDGRRLLLTDENARLRIWDTDTRAQLGDLPRREGDLLSPDGTLLAVVEEERWIVLSSVPGGEALQRIEAERASSLHFSPDSRLLLAEVAEPNRQLVIWEAKTGARRGEVSVRHDLRDFALSPDARRLALAFARDVDIETPGSGRSYLQIWDVERQPASLLIEREVELREEGSIEVHEPLSNLVYSPDGKRIAATTTYHALILDADSTRVFTRIDGPSRDPSQVGSPQDEEGIDSLHFSANGEFLGTLGWDGTEQTWSVFTGDLLWEEYVSGYGVAAGPFVAIPEQGGARIVDSRTGQELQRILREDKDSWLCGFTPNGAQIAFCNDLGVELYETGSAQEGLESSLQILERTAKDRYQTFHEGRHVVVQDRGERKEIARLERVDRPPVWSEPSPDGTLVVVIGWPEELAVVEVATGRDLWKRQGLGLLHEDEYGQLNLNHIRFNPSGSFIELATSDYDGYETLIFETETGREVAQGASDETVLYTADERYLILEEFERLLVFETSKGVALEPLPLEDYGQQFEWSAPNDLLARRIGNTVEVRRPGAPEALYTVRPGGENQRFEFSSEGTFLAVGASSKGVVLNAESGSSVLELAFEQPVKEFVFSPTERYLVPFGDEHDLGIWEIATGKRWARSLGASSRYRLHFSPDERLAVVSLDREDLKAVSLRDGKELAQLEANEYVSSVHFSLDGGFLALQESDWVQVWDTANWEHIGLYEHERVQRTQFVAGRPELATMSSGTRSRVWVLSKDVLLERACRSLDRNLTQSEWRREFRRESYRRTCSNLPAGNAGGSQ